MNDIQTGSGTADNLGADDDELLRRYLLGRLSDDLRERLDRRIFSDDSVLWEHLSLVENELIDDYVGGRLTAEDREHFERGFLCTDDRRQRVDLARALKAYASNQPQRRPSIGQWLRVPLSAPAWSVAMVLCVLLALPMVAWRSVSRPGAAPDVTAWLSTGRVRGSDRELRRVRIPQDCKLIRLQLEPSVERQAYGATVREAAGEQIWSQNRLSAAIIDGRMAVTLVVPSELLPDGDYYVELHGISANRDIEPLDEYDFRVLRE
jgi:hypothetical protein